MHFYLETKLNQENATPEEIYQLYEDLKPFYESASLPQNLNQLEVIFKNREFCLNTWKNYLNHLQINGMFNFDIVEKDDFICASGIAPFVQGTCSGDSGGPLMKIDVKTGKTQIIGIVSGGVKYGCISVVPNIYVRVSQYLPWINRNLETFIDTETIVGNTSNFSTALSVTITLSIVGCFVILCLNCCNNWKCILKRFFLLISFEVVTVPLVCIVWQLVY